MTIGGLEIDDSLIDAAAARLLASGGPAKLTGTDGFLPGLVKAVLERGLQAELTEPSDTCSTHAGMPGWMTRSSPPLRMATAR